MESRCYEVIQNNIRLLSVFRTQMEVNLNMSGYMQLNTD